MDQGDGIEHTVLNSAISIEEMLEQFKTKQAIAEVFKTLTPVQARRIYERFVMKKTIAEIANCEGVKWNTVKKSINTGLHKMLADLSVTEATAFTTLTEKAKAAL